jgi:histidyl-tRNA synthetase
MNSEETLLAPPRGMRDFYPEDMVVRNAIFDSWRTASHAFGFMQYDSCVVETLDVLKRKAGEEITDQIYAFVDKSGRELALRPEMTPTLARMVAARYASLSLPLKWYAIAQCFRYERMTRGRKREHYQWNLDIIGEPSVTAEAEVIATAVNALLAMGLTRNDFRIHFSSRTLLADLLVKLGIQPEHHHSAFLALDKKGKLGDGDIQKLLADSGLDNENIQKVFNLLNIPSLEDASGILEPNTPSIAAIRQFLAVLKAYGIDDIVKFDISVVRGLAYYTGIVFEAFDVNRKFRAIFGGGRYDNLLRDMGGAPATGVGLGFGDVVVAELLADNGRLPGATTHLDLAVGYMTDLEQPVAASIAAEMRRGGKLVDMALHAEKPKGFFSRTGKSSIREAIYLGPDDVNKGTVRVKDLVTRQEKEISIAQISGGNK